MKFVGGPMHGQEVIDELPREIIIGWAKIVRISAVDIDQAGHLVQGIHSYLEMPYWAPGKPIRFFYGWLKSDVDELAVLARRLFGL